MHNSNIAMHPPDTIWLAHAWLCNKCMQDAVWYREKATEGRQQKITSKAERFQWKHAPATHLSG